MDPRRATSADIPAIVALKQAAYLPNETITGAPSLPRMADYDRVFAEHEIWVVDGEAGLAAALVLETGPDAFTIWSIAVAPEAAGRKLGGALMAFAEARPGRWDMARSISTPTPSFSSASAGMSGWASR